MSDSAIERLKQRQRKKVPARKSFLTQQDNSELSKNSHLSNEINSNDAMTKSSQTSNQSDSNSVTTFTSQSVKQLESNDLITEERQTLDLEIEPIRRTIRLDPSIDEFMATLCKENKVTRETLIEATISICSKNQKTLNKAIVEAKDRYKYRKRIGELKKLQTMNQKFNRNIS